MPRKTSRTVNAEQVARQRIRSERRRHNWTEATLARRLTERGTPMTQSTISKIERGTPKRGISLDEAYGFAKVFGIGLDDLVTPPPTAGDRKQAQQIHRDILAIEAQQELLEGRLEEAWDAFLDITMESGDDAEEETVTDPENPDAWYRELDRIERSFEIPMEKYRSKQRNN